jgi:hypothetical protein
MCAMEHCFIVSLFQCIVRVRVFTDICLSLECCVHSIASRICVIYRRYGIHVLCAYVVLCRSIVMFAVEHCCFIVSLFQCIVAFHAVVQHSRYYKE